MADERDPCETERVDEPEQVGREVFGAVRRRLRPLALAVTALIERDHVKSLGERGRHEVEPVGMRGAAVQETEDRAPRVAPFEKAQAESADHDRAPARALASEA